MAKTLYLEKRGCNFWSDDKINNISDVGNYRVGSYDYSIKGKDGNNYVLEFTNWDRYTYRKINKRTGKPLKHEVKEVLLLNALHVDTEFENERGTWANLKLESKLHEKPMLYTLENILKVVNEISVDHYDKVEFVN